MCHINCRIVSVLVGVYPVCSRNPFLVDLKILKASSLGYVGKFTER